MTARRHKRRCTRGGGAIEIAAGLLRPAAAASLTGPVTNLRRYSAARSPSMM